MTLPQPACLPLGLVPSWTTSDTRPQHPSVGIQCMCQRTSHLGSMPSRNRCRSEPGERREGGMMLLYRLQGAGRRGAAVVVRCLQVGCRGS